MKNSQQMQTPTIFLYSLTSVPTTCISTTKHLSAVQRRFRRKAKKQKKLKEKIEIYAKTANFRGD